MCERKDRGINRERERERERDIAGKVLFNVLVNVK